MRIKLTDKAKATPDFKLPHKKRAGDAGYDMYLMEDVTFLPNTTTIVDTGICVELPTGWAGRFTLRSSTSSCGLVMQEPLIDSNYRGEIHAIVLNTTDHEISYKKGERVWSVFFFPIMDEELEVVDELSETNRGDRGFGSSGK